MGIVYTIPGVRKIVLLLQKAFFIFLYGRHFGGRVTVFGLPIIRFSRGSKVQIGDDLVLISASFFSEPGVNHPVILRTLSENATLTIGDHVGISGGGICVAKAVSIGNSVMLGANVLVTDTDFHPLVAEGRRYSHAEVMSKEVNIEDNVFIGMNSLILKGAHIGANSVIAAGSIVTTDIPANVIAGGTPAKIIRNL